MRNTVRIRRAKQLAGIGASVTALLALAACGGNAGSGEDGDVVLRFSWWGSDVRHEYTQQLIDEFESQNPGITIEPDFTGWDDYWNKLATSVAGRQTPDIMQQDTRYVREYADRGALADLSDYLGDTIDDTNLDPAVKDFASTDEGLFAVPTGINAFSVVVDPELYKAAGVEVPDDTTWTWDDFVETTTAVSKGSKGEFYGTQDMGFVETSFEVFARQRGEALFTEDGIGFSEDTLRDFWNTIVELRDKGAEPPASTTVEVQAGGIDMSLLSTNKGAGGFWWTNELPTLEANSGHDLQLMRFPGESEQPGMYLKPAMFWAVSAQSEHPEEAAKFLDFMLNSEDAAKVMLSDRGLPINLELREAVVPDLQPADQESAEFLAEITPELDESPVLPPKGAGEVQEIMQRLNEQVLFDQITVDEAVEQLMSDVESALG